MKDFKKHIISEDAKLMDALQQLNRLSGNMILFVVNSKHMMVGALTDGDIRRGMLKGLSQMDLVSDYMNRQYRYLEKRPDPLEVIKLRDEGFKVIPLLDDGKRILKVFDLSRLKNILPVDAVIMAGGRGVRLKPLTDDTPKPMLKLGKKPIMEYTIDGLIEYGIENIHITINYLGHLIKEYFGNGSSKGINLHYVEESEPLGTVGGLSLIDNFNNDTILLTNSDLFTNINYEDFYLNFIREKADMAVASIPYTVNIPYAVFNRKGSRVKSFSEKPINTHFANAGIYLLKRNLIELIPRNQPSNATDLMQKVIDKGMTLIHNALVGYWIDIGKHEDYEKAKEIVKHL